MMNTFLHDSMRRFIAFDRSPVPQQLNQLVTEYPFQVLGIRFKRLEPGIDRAKSAKVVVQLGRVTTGYRRTQVTCPDELNPLLRLF
jgi:hypothetical protein